MTTTYNGPLATAAFVAGTINDAQANAKSQSAASATTFTQAAGYINNMPTIPSSDSASLGGYATLATRINQALTYEARGESEFALGIGKRDQPSTLVNSYVKDLQDKLTNDITLFYTQYFPNVLPTLQASLQQMQDGINYGGMTVRKSVSNLKWQVQVDAILRKAAQDEEDLLDKYAAKRFTAPPGALFKKIADMQELAQRAIAQASNAVAIADFDTELEATRTYIAKAIEHRNAALDAFGQYLTKMTVLRYDHATARAGEQDDAWRMLREVYFKDQMAQRDAELWTRKIVQKDFDLASSSLYDTEQFWKSQLEQFFMAALASADRLSTLAATAFNILRGAAVMQSTESG